MANRYQYTVVELREGMIGGKMSGDKLEQVLNEHAAQGWRLRAITSVEVKGRVGPGGVEGLLVTFERPVGCAKEHGTGTVVVDRDPAPLGALSRSDSNENFDVTVRPPSGAC
jgi:hypothetical protein